MPIAVETKSKHYGNNIVPGAVILSPNTEFFRVVFPLP